MAEAALRLRRGELVAFPTETVYGLGASALDPAAVERIYQAKGRPSFNPLIVHVRDREAAKALVTEWPEAAERLAARWWPGPLTLVLPKRALVPDLVTAGLPTVALRVPAHPVALALLEAASIPLAAPSANRSGQVSPTTARHVAQSLGDVVPLILDAGPTPIGIESTVLDLSRSPPALLRPGAISRAEIEAVIGPLGEGSVSVEAGEAARPSPGMLERHYAPRARVLLFPREAAELMDREAEQLGGQGERVGALLRTTVLRCAQLLVTLPPDPAGYARELYRGLHELDQSGCTIILIEEPPHDAAWEAVRDRLARAAKVGVDARTT
jgi:L-threonylcarbamoyladenylate synthase